MAKTEYVEQILLKLKTDKTDLEKVKKEFDELNVVDVLSPEQKKKFEEEFKLRKQHASALKKVEEEILELKELGGKEAKKAIKTLQKAYRGLKAEQSAEDVQKTITDFTIKELGKVFDSFKQFITDIWTDAKQMMKDIASFSENSTVYSSEATQLKLQYGLTGAQAYAYEKASQETGFSSFDDFVQNQMFATKETKERWKELSEKYQQTYEQDKEIAEEFQKFTTEWNDFKKEMQMELIDFFMENKETIKQFLDFSMEFMEGVLQILGTVVSLLGNDSNRSDRVRSAATADILQQYSTSNNKVSNVNITNTFNGVQKSDQIQLQNAGNLTYQQIINALK